ncbi:MAG: hypothetical protein KGH75_05565, partial [Rhodospirillales bacterium]|nr:hypothetical protein [Rhodospirillales bacterium]
KDVFSRYDAADGLKTEEDIAAFLEAAAKDGASAPAFMARVLDVVARARKRLGRPKDWNGLVDAIKAGGVPHDFLSPGERADDQPYRDPGLEGGTEFHPLRFLL